MSRCGSSTPEPVGAPIDAGPVARLYVCGITPYDATHLGHAATYVTFDLVGRVLRDAGHQVDYVQNVTDIDDPLLERAARDGLDWRDLATSQIDLFREDMTALAVIPPDASSASSSRCRRSPRRCGRSSRTARPTGCPCRRRRAPATTSTSTSPRHRRSGRCRDWTREQMTAVFADRGGDPERIGKRDPLDPLLWRGAREGEPSWDDDLLGAGRPGWHIECTAISLHHLGPALRHQGWRK